MVTSDVLAILAAALLATLAAGLLGRQLNLWGWWVAVLLLTPVWVAVAHATGLYRIASKQIHVDLGDEIGPTIVGATAWIWCFVLLWAFLEPAGLSLLVPSVLWVFAVTLILVFRSIARTLVVRFGWHRRSVAIIGDADDVITVMDRVGRHSEWGLDPVATIMGTDDNGFRVTYLNGADGESPDADGKSLEADGKIEKDATAMAEIVVNAGASRAFLAGGRDGLRSTTALIQALVERGCAVDYVSGGAETLYSTAVLHHLEGLPVLSVTPTEPGPVASVAKRAIDITIASAALLLTSPILAWAAIRIKLDSPGPALFRQRRPGLHGEPFTIIKLRTMEEGAESRQDELRRDTLQERDGEVLFKLKDDPRVTSFGEKIRRLSLDELPQLWNVLRGDMSIVGPRPVLFEETALVPRRYSTRSSMKPGICGPWQVLGRSDIPFEDMIRLDYTYVVGWSLAEDLRLILRTALVVTRRKGAY